MSLVLGLKTKLKSPEITNGECIMANEIKAKQNASLALFGDDVSKGFENMTQEDMALPFVRILGQLSPQVTDGDAKYIDGAKPGMIYNTVTSELYDGKKGIKVIPCYYKKDYPDGRIEGMVQVLLWLYTYRTVR